MQRSSSVRDEKSPPAATEGLQNVKNTEGHCDCEYDKGFLQVLQARQTAESLIALWENLGAHGAPRDTAQGHINSSRPYIKQLWLDAYEIHSRSAHSFIRENFELLIGHSFDALESALDGIGWFLTSEQYRRSHEHTDFRMVRPEDLA